MSNESLRTNIHRSPAERLHLHAAGSLGLKEGVVHLLHVQVQLVCSQQQVPA